MYSENGVLVDFEEISQLLAGADVFVIRFANFPERLLVDTRKDAYEIPLVQVVEPSNGPRQRLAWLMRRRPSLGTPSAFSAFPWPHSPAFLVGSGIWDRIRRTVSADFNPEVDAQCKVAMSQLENLDRQSIASAIRGENYLTLWPREPEEAED